MRANSNALGGEFATSSFHAIDAGDVVFIHAKVQAGYPVPAIARMLGKSADSVRAVAPPSTPRLSYEQIALMPCGLHGMPPAVAQIIRAVAEKHQLTIADLKGACRKNRFAFARFEAMARIYALGRFSYSQIGGWLGGRDHTTVLNGARRHAERLAAGEVAE